MSGGGVAGPLPRISAYAASKIAVVRFMEGLSKEVEDYNIKVNTVAPGAINTDMLKEILKSGPKKIGKHYFEKALIQKSKEEHPAKMFVIWLCCFPQLII